MAGLLALALGGAGLVVLPQLAVSPAAAAAPVCRAEAVDEVLAAQLAARCAARVEVLSERTESAQTFVEPDGRRRLVASAVPQRIHRADGSWAAISAGLVRQADGSFKPAATLADVAFSGGGSGPLVTWREAGRSFTLSWPLGKLPAPRVSGATAVYESVLPGVNLHLVATAEGYKHTVEVLTAAAAANPAVRQLRYTTGGDLQVKANPDGSLRLVDGSGRAVATSMPARMWDSSADPALAGEVLPEVAAQWAAGAPRPVVVPATAALPAVTSRSAQVSVAVSAGQVRVAADAAFLTDPKVTYPVFIDPSFEKQRAKWAYATSNGEGNDTSSARVGNNPDTAGTYRSFYDFDVSGLKGKKILSGTVRITLDHSWSCGPTWVHLYRTSAITVSSGGRMAWSTRPLPSGVYLDGWEGNANEAGGCGSVQPDKEAEFVGAYVTNDLQLAANSNWNGYTVGLCACNTDGGYETTEDRWKRFYTDKAWIEVVYDSVPATPSNLTTSGQACGSAIVTQSPVFKAYYADADAAADSLTGYFEYQQTAPTVGGVITKTGQTKPGNAYGDSGTIALGAASEGRTYQWRVKTKDAAGYESNPVWSPWCSFTVDADAPPKPGVTSAQYPADGVAHGGPGEPGTFAFTAGATDVVKYVYGWAGQALATVSVTAGTGHAPALTPPRHGFNTLDVYTIDTAGRPSPTTHYEFLVGSPDAPVAHWPLDTIDQHQYKDEIGDADLTPEGDVSMVYDNRIIGEGVTRYNGSSHLTTANTLIDTTKSFSVAAWARLDPAASPTSSHVVASQEGDQRSRFLLYYAGNTGTWRFYMYDGDNAASSSGNAVTGPAAVFGRWTHLVATYDAATKQMGLYVDGVPAPTTPHTPVWAATGPFNVGRYEVGGSSSSRFLGEITDVRVWQRVIVPDDLHGTDDDPAAGTQAVRGILAPTEVANWDFNGSLTSVCSSSISSTYWAQNLDLYGCTDPYSTAQTAGYINGGPDNNETLWLNSPQAEEGWGTGGNGYASTSGPVIRTDQSFTVSAWVKLASGGADKAVVTQMGGPSYAPPFLLIYDWPSSRWAFTMTSGPVASPVWQPVYSIDVAQVDAWVHLTAVYDTATASARLYVNGVSQGTRTGIVTWNSDDVLNVGSRAGGSYSLDGQIDAVRVFVGAMSDREVRSLYANS